MGQVAANASRSLPNPGRGPDLREGSANGTNERPDSPGVLARDRRPATLPRDREAGLCFEILWLCFCRSARNLDRAATEE